MLGWCNQAGREAEAECWLLARLTTHGDLLMLPRDTSAPLRGETTAEQRSRAWCKREGKISVSVKAGLSCQGQIYDHALTTAPNAGMNLKSIWGLTTDNTTLNLRNAPRYRPKRQWQNSHCSSCAAMYKTECQLVHKAARVETTLSVDSFVQWVSKVMDSFRIAPKTVT